MIIVVGAGLAGLVCARLLHQQGRSVVVLDASDGPGGRLRTRVHPEGFLLDRGFQVLLTAYPAARRQLSYSQLDLRPLAPGAIIAHNGHLTTLADPFRQPDALLSTLATRLIDLGDKMRIVSLRRTLLKTPVDKIFAGSDMTTRAYLQQFGFSDRALALFFEPFFGGIFLDRGLTTSALMFQFVFKMMAEGQVAVPARGIEAIPQHIARGIPYDAMRYGIFVQSVLTDSGEVRGVLLSNGEVLRSDTVVVATNAPEAARLTGARLPPGSVGTTCVYFASDTPLYHVPSIVLNAELDAYVNNLVQISTIAPTYAPEGQHLISATVLGIADSDDRAVADRCRDDIARMFPKFDVNKLRRLDVVRVPYAQFSQPPGIFAAVPGHATATRGLYVAGEFNGSSSIQGAIASGEAAAARVLADESR